MNWREELQKHFKITGDSFDNIIINISDEELDREFNGGYGSSEGTSFQAWSDHYTYFNYEYDGSDFILRVPRHPPGYIDEQMEKIMLEDNEQ